MVIKIKETKNTIVYYREKPTISQTKRIVVALSEPVKGIKKWIVYWDGKSKGFDSKIKAKKFAQTF